MIEYTREGLLDLMEDWGYGEPAFEKVSGWIVRGDDVLVYRNMDLGHHMVGHPVFLSYGSLWAQVPREEYPEPPSTCPVDLGAQGLMSWRYRLEGVLHVEDK